MQAALMGAQGVGARAGLVHTDPPPIHLPHLPHLVAEDLLLGLGRAPRPLPRGSAPQPGHRFSSTPVT